jgi:predicted lipoprotein with Yx(FWY)xxD motif
MIRLIAIGAASGLLLLAGCGGDDDEDSGGAAATETSPTATSASKAASPTANGTAVKLAGSDYGQVLFDGDNQAIYLFDKEQGAKSECYGECAAAWPPVVTNGDPQAGQGVDTSLLGTIKRDDGTTQVTYGGHPLYYYAHEGPGQVLCQNVDEFGGLWLVVKADGDPVRGA